MPGPVRRGSALLVAAALALTALGSAVPARADDGADYIVTTASDRATDRTIRSLPTDRVEVDQRYRHVLDGFSATLTAAQAARLRTDPTVESVRPVTRVSASDIDPATVTRQDRAPWGLDRIDRRSGLDGTYFADSTGAGVTAYVIDTGVLLNHADFGGRLRRGYDFVDGDTNASDCPGNYRDDPVRGLISHGTHVAGIIGGRTYGVAKQVDLVALRVLDCRGSGTDADVIAALDWVVANRPSTPAVVNLSLGGPPSTALDAAVAAVVAAGVPVVVAAGNDSSDACGDSPARVPAALTVGASTRADRQALDFTNYGRCLDLFAPGADILSAGTRTTTASLRLDGTSMAAPHVAGAVARRLQTDPAATPAEVAAAITGSATTVAGLRDRDGSPAKLLYVASPTSPTAPTAIAGSRSDATRSATVRWGAPAGDGGFDVTGYRVVRTGRDAAGRSSQSVELGAGARSARFAGLVPGTTYTLSVRARNRLGLGPATSTRVVITALPGKTKISSVRSGSSKDRRTSVAVRWSKPASGGPVRSYLVTATRSGTGTVTKITVPGSARSATVARLKKGKSYVVRVQALNDTGSGPVARWKKAVRAR